MSNEINLLDYWRAIAKWKKTIIGTVFVTTTCFVSGSYFLPIIFKAKATLMPIGGSKASDFAVSASGQVPAAALLGSLLPMASSSTSQIMAILTSRTMAERIIDKHGLIAIFFPQFRDQKNQMLLPNNLEERRIMEDAVNKLRAQVSISENRKTQLIEISAEMNNPGLASKIVNGFVKELANYISENTFTSAKRNRLFIEEQLERNKTELLESGKELSDFYSTKKVSNIVPTVDVNVAIENGKSRTKADTKVFASHAPGFSDSPGDFADLGRKTDDLKKKIGETDAQIRKKIVAGIPQQVYLQYLTFRRELLGQVNALLTQQYEMAKIEEAKEELTFQVIDWAPVPARKFKPRRVQILLVSLTLSLFLALSYTFFREYLEKIKQ